MSALMLSALDDLQAVMFKWKSQESVIKPVLTKIKNQWHLTFEEEWYHDSGGSYTINSGSVMLDDIVKWAEKELEKCKDCRRTAWHLWQFKSKRDAEKFITFFHLSWEQ